MGAEIGQFTLGKRLPANDQYRTLGPQGAQLRERFLGRPLPKAQPQDLARKAVTDRPVFPASCLPPSLATILP
jgi:hypothetical protein